MNARLPNNYKSILNNHNVVSFNISHNITAVHPGLYDLSLDRIAAFQILRDRLVLKLQPHIDLIAHNDVRIYDRLVAQPVLIPNEQPNGRIPGNQILDQYGIAVSLAHHPIILVMGYKIPAYPPRGFYQAYPLQIATDIIPRYVAQPLNNTDAGSGAIPDRILHYQRAVTIDAP